MLSLVLQMAASSSALPPCASGSFGSEKDREIGRLKVRDLVHCFYLCLYMKSGSILVT